MNCFTLLRPGRIGEIFAFLFWRELWNAFSPLPKTSSEIRANRGMGLDFTNNIMIFLLILKMEGGCSGWKGIDSLPIFHKNAFISAS